MLALGNAGKGKKPRDGSMITKTMLSLPNEDEDMSGDGVRVERVLGKEE